MWDREGCKKLKGRGDDDLSDLKKALIVSLNCPELLIFFANSKIIIFLPMYDCQYGNFNGIKVNVVAP